LLEEMCLSEILLKEKKAILERIAFSERKAPSAEKLKLF
jgi:hypothetical protein